MSLLAQSDAWSGVAIGEHLFYFSPLIALVCTMLAVVAFPIVLGRGTRVVLTIVSLGLVAAFILALRVAGALVDGGVSGFSPTPGGGLLIADNLSIGFQILLFVFMAGVIWLWSIGSAETERNAPEFFILLIGSAVGMVMMVGTLNLLMIVIAIETASLPSYAIVGFDKTDRRGSEACLKYMIFGAVCAAIMLYGVSLLYGLVGSLNVADVAVYTVNNLAMGPNRVVLSVGLLCLFCGLAFKISAVPFHFWCPDVFQGAKIEVTTWLSVASKAAGLVLLARVCLTFCGAVDSELSMSLIRPLAWMIGIVAAVTCTVGNFSAYKQRSVKRLLAYSSIAHAGYMLMAVAVFIHPDVAGHQSGLTALLIYIVIYVFMNLGAFGVTALVAWGTGSDDIESFTGLIRRSPGIAIPMIICLMSLVGLPPLAGFIGKWWILVALGSLSSVGGSSGVFSYGSLGWFLVIVAVLNTLISLYYYMRIVVQMTLRDDGKEALRPPLGGIALVNLCAIALLVLFIWAQPLRSSVEHYSHGLFQATVSADHDDATVAKADVEPR